MKCLFIINPKSGKDKVIKKLDKIVGQLILEEIIDKIDIYYTKKKNDAYKKCLNLKKYDLVVGYGGDGTVNEIFSGLIESDSHIPLAIIPGGTVNDFATHMDLPKTTKAFINMIKDMNIEKVDVGKINQQYFANVIACGMFSDISFQVSKEEKAKYGPLAYYATGLRQLPKQLATQMNLHVTCDDKVFDEEASLFMITNTSQVGGIKGITPDADVRDGLLDLLIIKKCNPAEMISIIKDYTTNNLEESHFIKYIQASYIKIESDTDLIYDVDGEIGQGFPIEVSVVKQKLNLVVPKRS